jgi:hypothetical protein
VAVLIIWLRETEMVVYDKVFDKQGAQHRARNINCNTMMAMEKRMT